MDTEREYYLLLVDIAGSTRLTSTEAERALAALREALDGLNRELGPVLVLNLTVSYGDEVAGLFASPVPLHAAMTRIREVLRPWTAARYVASKGRVAIASDDIRQVGGTVFKRASAAMARLKRSGRTTRWLIADTPVDPMLTALTDLSEAFVEDMTNYQYDVYRLLASGVTQKAAAAELGKFPQSISDAVKRGHVDLVIEAERAVRLQLEALDAAL
jgi:hypothetical protein